jgi:hypothetical protein
MRALIAITAFLVVSCDVYYDIKPSYVHPELQPYVDSFKHEAQIRGISLDTDGLVVDFGDLDGEAGTSYQGRRKVLIDRDKLHDYNAEELVFHELSHVLLKRGHDNQKIGKRNLIVKSLMHKNESAGYEYEGLSYRREYYINELFNPSTPAPEWSFEQ